MNYSVCIQGFSSFEHATFESFFRLAARRVPSYQCTDDIAQADIVIADADRPASMDAVARAGKLPRTLTIGARPVSGSAAGTSRPINMMALLRMLDEITSNGTLRSPAGAMKRSAPAPTSMAPMREAAGPTPKGGGEPGAAHILVVDDSDIALRVMQTHLSRLRFQVSLASSGDEALRLLETRRYAFVFLDVMMAGSDGFQTCRHIKRMNYPDGVEPPRVIMLTSKGGPIDKLRGSIAGCDGYLVKPLNEQELVKVITEFDPGFTSRVEGTLAV